MSDQWSPQELELVRRRLGRLRGEVARSVQERGDALPEAKEVREQLTGVERLARAESDDENDVVAEIDALLGAAERSGGSDLARVLSRLTRLARSAESPKVRRILEARLRKLVRRFVRAVARGEVDANGERVLAEAIAVLAGSGLLEASEFAGVFDELERVALRAREARVLSGEAGEDQDPRAAFADRLLERMDSNIRCARTIERAESFGAERMAAGGGFVDAIERRLMRANLGVFERVRKTLAVAEGFARFDRRFGMLQALLGGALEDGEFGSVMTQALAAALGIDVAVRMGGSAYERVLAQLPELVVAARAARDGFEGLGLAAASPADGPREVDYGPAFHPRRVGWPEMMEFHSEGARPWYGFEGRPGWGGPGRGRWQLSSAGGTLPAFSRLIPAIGDPGFRAAELGPGHAGALRSMGALTHVALGYGELGRARLEGQAALALQQTIGRGGGGATAHRADLLASRSPLDAAGFGLRSLGLTAFSGRSGTSTRLSDTAIDGIGVPRLAGSVRMPLAGLEAVRGFDPLGSLVLPSAGERARARVVSTTTQVGGFSVDDFGIARLRSVQLDAPRSARYVPGFAFDVDGGAVALRAVALGRALRARESTARVGAKAPRLGDLGFVAPSPVRLAPSMGWLEPASSLITSTVTPDLGLVGTPAGGRAGRVSAAAPFAISAPLRTGMRFSQALEPYTPPVSARGLMPQITATTLPLGFTPGVLVSAPQASAPRPRALNKYYAPLEGRGLALGALARFGLAAFGGASRAAGRSVRTFTAHSLTALPGLASDFAPAHLTRLSAPSQPFDLRETSWVAPAAALARLRGMPFDSAGFAPAGRLGRAADLDLEAAALVAPRWRRFGRALETVRGRYSGERLHGDLGLEGLALAWGNDRRRSPVVGRASAPRLSAVYGRGALEIAEGLAARAPGDPLRLASHGGLEARYAASRSVARLRSLGFDAELFVGAGQALGGWAPVATASGSVKRRAVGALPMALPVGAVRSSGVAGFAASGGVGVRQGTLRIAAAGREVGVAPGGHARWSFEAGYEAQGEPATLLYRYLDAIGAQSARTTVLDVGGSNVGREAGVRNRALFEAAAIPGKIGAAGLRRRAEAAWAPRVQGRGARFAAAAERFRLDGWLDQRGLVGEGAWRGDPVRRLGSRRPAASLPLDLVSQLTLGEQERHAYGLGSWSGVGGVVAGRRFAAKRLHERVGEEARFAWPVGGGSEAARVGVRRGRGVPVAGRRVRSQEQDAFWRWFEVAGEASGSAPLRGGGIGRERRGPRRLSMLPGIELGGAFVERAVRSRFAGGRARRQGVELPIGLEWLEVVQSAQDQERAVPAALLPVTDRARARRKGLGFRPAIGQGAARTDGLGLSQGRIRVREARRRAAAEAAAFEEIRRAVVDELELVGGAPELEAHAPRAEAGRPSRGLADAFRPRRRTGGAQGPVFRPTPPQRSRLTRGREPVMGPAPRIKMVNTGVGAPREQYDLAEVLQQAFDLPEEALPVMRKGLFSGLATNVKKALGEVTQWIAELEKLRKPRQRTPDISQLVYQVYERIKTELEWDAMRRGAC